MTTRKHWHFSVIQWTPELLAEAKQVFTARLQSAYKRESKGAIRDNKFRLEQLEAIKL